MTHNGLTEAILSLAFFAADVLKMADIREGRYLAVACALPLNFHIFLVCDEIPSSISQL